MLLGEYEEHGMQGNHQQLDNGNFNLNKVDTKANFTHQTSISQNQPKTTESIQLRDEMEEGKKNPEREG